MELPLREFCVFCMKKIYCYVDETGQDTQGRLFIVCVVILELDKKESFSERLITIEQNSGKGISKWNKTQRHRRERYIQGLLQEKASAYCVYYSSYENSTSYTDLTILATAKAIHRAVQQPYIATIIVDGLQKNRRYQFAAGLRGLHIAVRKVRGARDESDPWIRLADAYAGMIRSGIEGTPAMEQLYNRCIDVGIIYRV